MTPYRVNLRGPSGSGKTTIARRVLEHETEVVMGEPYVNKFGSKRAGWPLHLCDTPVGQVIVHGRYDVAQGGCDTEKDIQIVEDSISWGMGLYPDSHHLFEGLMLSKSKTRWFDFVSKHPGNWRWVWLDTEPEECIRRVMSRNGGRQISGKEIHSGHKTMMSQYREIKQFAQHGIQASRVETDVDVWSLFSD